MNTPYFRTPTSLDRLIFPFLAILLLVLKTNAVFAKEPTCNVELRKVAPTDLKSYELEDRGLAIQKIGDAVMRRFPQFKGNRTAAMAYVRDQWKKHGKWPEGMVYRGMAVSENDIQAMRKEGILPSHSQYQYIYTAKDVEEGLRFSFGYNGSLPSQKLAVLVEIDAKKESMIAAVS